jgi:hypothetical protein
MTHAIATTAGIFRTRDLFVHDGSHLRRLRLSAPVQMAMLVLILLLTAWSAYSALRLFTASGPTSTQASSTIPSDIARLADGMLQARRFVAHGALASEYACNLFHNAVTLTAADTTVAAS